MPLMRSDPIEVGRSTSTRRHNGLRGGTLLSSQAVGPKLEWVRRHEPEVFERATGWYGSNSYIAAKLTGEYVMDHHTASQCDPLYATREFDWNHQWAQRSLALAAGTSTAGSLIGWLQSVTGGAPFDDLMAEAQTVPPGSKGLLVLPYLAGERTPVFDPQARGVVAGLTLRHGRGHLFQAAYEGISFGIRQILERFDGAHTAVRTVGGR